MNNYTVLYVMIASGCKELKEDTKMFIRKNLSELVQIFKFCVFLFLMLAGINSEIKISLYIFLVFVSELVKRMMKRARISEDFPVNEFRYTERTRYGVAVEEKIEDEAFRYLCDVEDYLQKKKYANYKNGELNV